jgi:hypothetical protein
MQGWMRNRHLVRYLASHAPEAVTVRKKLAACGVEVYVRRYANGDCRALCVSPCSLRRLCEICAAKERRRRVAELGRAFEELLRQDPSLKLAVITLTVTSSADLLDCYQRLNSAWQRLRRRCTEARRGRVRTEWAKVRAGVANFEVARGKSGDWHVHIHIPLLHEGELDEQVISDEWLRVTGDSHVTHVKRIPQSMCVGQDALRKRINNEVGYTLKFGDLSPADLWEAHCVLRGRQLSRMFGDLIGLELPEREPFGVYRQSRLVMAEGSFVPFNGRQGGDHA